MCVCVCVLLSKILKSDRIEQIEGASSGIATPHSIDTDVSLFDASSSDSCREAFRVLRQKVNTLYQDCMENKNAFADMLLTNLYRW